MKKTNSRHKLFAWKEYHEKLGCFDCRSARRSALGKAPCCQSKKAFQPPCGNELCAGLILIKKEV